MLLGKHRGALTFLWLEHKLDREQQVEAAVDESDVPQRAYRSVRSGASKLLSRWCQCGVGNSGPVQMLAATTSACWRRQQR